MRSAAAIAHHAGVVNPLMLNRPRPIRRRASTDDGALSSQDACVRAAATRSRSAGGRERKFAASRQGSSPSGSKRRSRFERSREARPEGRRSISGADPLQTSGVSVCGLDVGFTMMSSSAHQSASPCRPGCMQKSEPSSLLGAGTGSGPFFCGRGSSQARSCSAPSEPRLRRRSRFENNHA